MTVRRRQISSANWSGILHNPESRLLFCTVVLFLPCGRIPVLFSIEALLMHSSANRTQELPVLCILAHACLVVIASLTGVKWYLTVVKLVWEAESLSISLGSQSSILWKLVASAFAGGQSHSLRQRRIPLGDWLSCFLLNYTSEAPGKLFLRN